MKPFDLENPPTTLEDFADSVFYLIDKSEIYIDEYYPDALFIVDKSHSGDIIYADDISEEKGISLEKVVRYEFPKILKNKEVKWYACACLLENKSGHELLLVVYGDTHTTGACTAKVFEEEEKQVLDDWNEIHPDGNNFSQIIVPLRRAIVNQG